MTKQDAKSRKATSRQTASSVQEPAAHDPAEHEPSTYLPRATLEWLAGKRICVVGKTGGMIKKELRRFVKETGGLLVAQDDPEVNMVIIGADSFPYDLSKLPNPMKEKIEAGQVEIVEESSFWERCGQSHGLKQDLASLYTPAMLADLLGVQRSQVRRWYKRGLIRPTLKIHRLPYFDFQEIATARKLVQWLAHQSADQIEKKLVKLAKLVPAANRSLSQLPIVVQGKEVFLKELGGIKEPRGQKLFDFHYESPQKDSLENEPEATIPFLTIANESTQSTDRPVSTSGPSVPFPGKPDSTGSVAENVELLEASGLEAFDRLLFDALEYEEQGKWDEAIGIYRSVILADGLTAELSFQIGELLYRKGDLDGARERYFVAIELDDTFVEARANLGCVLSEQHQWDLAISVFQGALALHPNYADVLFHLASCYDKVGQRQKATKYWIRFFQQAPSSPWAAYAEARIAADDQSTSEKSTIEKPLQGQT